MGSEVVGWSTLYNTISFTNLTCWIFTFLGRIRSRSWRIQSRSSRRSHPNCHLSCRSWKWIHRWCQVRRTPPSSPSPPQGVRPSPSSSSRQTRSPSREICPRTSSPSPPSPNRRISYQNSNNQHLFLHQRAIHKIHTFQLWYLYLNTYTNHWSEQ